MLYRRLLGHEWDELDPALQALHEGDRPRCGRGVFSIRYGSAFWARLLTRLTSLPAAGVDVPVTLEVVSQPDEEIWRRRFGRRLFVTRQMEGPVRQLLEMAGPLRLHCRLSVVAGALLYRQVAASMMFLGHGLPLPAWLAPQVSARESPEDRGPWIHVQVQLRHRVLGPIIAYEGRMLMERRET